MFNLRPPGQKPLLGTPMDMENPLSPGLLCALNINERSGNRGYDASGNGNHGTITGPIWNASNLNFAGNGSTDQVELDRAISFAPGSPWTIEVSCYIESIFQYSTFFGYDFAVSKYTRLQGNIARLQLYNDANNLDYQDNGVVVGKQVYTITSDSANAKKMYRNGVVIKSFSQSGTYTFLHFGSAGGTLDDSLDGDLFHARIWNRDLTLQEVQSHYIDPYQMWPDSAIWMGDLAAAVGGWTHKWNTIAAANIAAINTVPIANIAKINTV